MYTTKWYSLPIMLTWLNIVAIEGWFYGSSHRWHESGFVGANLAFANLALVAFAIIEWAYHSDKSKYWNDGKSDYYDNRSHELGIYVPRRRNNG